MIKDLKAGDPVVVGPYKLLGRLGAGGMGQVYLAKSPGGRLVAIKLIRPELAEDRGFRSRFADEIAAARNVSGIYTAAVVDADSDAELPWMATVYVPGPSLTDAVEDHGPLPVKSVLALAAGLAEALEAIHRAGLVHRDMKPSNVLLATDGPRVIDFGISRALERSMMTTTGMVLGSPGFMSPEQAAGEQVGQPTDVFSLGAVLAYAATGAGPFGAGPTPALLYRVVKEEPDLTNVPSRLRPLVTQCLAKDPAQRPTPAALLASLSDEVGVLTGEWLPQQIADGMSRYSPTLQTPLPPSLREPDSVPGEPVPADPLPAAASVPAADPLPAAASVPAAEPVPAESAGATRAEYILPDTSLVQMPVPVPGGPAPVAASASTAPTAAVPAGPAGPTTGTPLANPRRRRRWPFAAAAAVLVVIAVVAAFALARSPGGTHRNTGPTPSVSLDETLTSSPSAAATATKPASQPAVTAASTAPGAQPSTAPAAATSSAAGTPTQTQTSTSTATPTSSPTASPTATATTTTTQTATATATATTAGTATATAAPTPTQPASPAEIGRAHV